jgi:hypothetical protein
VRQLAHGYGYKYAGDSGSGRINSPRVCTVHSRMQELWFVDVYRVRVVGLDESYNTLSTFETLELRRLMAVMVLNAYTLLARHTPVLYHCAIANYCIKRVRRPRAGFRKFS